WQRGREGAERRHISCLVPVCAIWNAVGRAAPAAIGASAKPPSRDAIRSSIISVARCACLSSLRRSTRCLGATTIGVGGGGVGGGVGVGVGFGVGIGVGVGVGAGAGVALSCSWTFVGFTATDWLRPAVGT